MQRAVAEAVALQQNRLPAPHQTCRVTRLAPLAQSRSLPNLTELPSRLLSGEASTSPTSLPRRFLSNGGCRERGEGGDASSQLSLRERLASTTRIARDLKPEVLARLDAIVAERGVSSGMSIPALEKFASHAHKFRGGAKLSGRSGSLAEDLPLSAFAKTLPADLGSMVAQASERSCSALSTLHSSLHSRPQSQGRRPRTVERCPSPPSPPPKPAGWKVDVGKAVSPHGTHPEGRSPRRGDRSPGRAGSKRANAAQVHKLDWGDTWWLEEVPTPTAAAATTGGVSPSASRSAGSPEPQQRSPSGGPVGRSGSHRVSPSRQGHGYVAALAASHIQSGPVLLNGNEAAVARRAIMEATQARRRLLQGAASGGAATAAGTEGGGADAVALAGAGYASASGWRLRSMEQTSLRSMARS